MSAGRKEEHSSPASSLLTMRYNINLFFVACTAREHTFTRYKVYMRGGSALFFFSRMYSRSHPIWCGSAQQACTAREHVFTRYKVYTRGGSAQI